MEEAFGRARFTQHLKTKGIDVNKMHSDNVKDAEAAKKRAASAQSDLDSFRKKTGVTSESVEDLSGHTARRLATIIRNPMHPMHAAAKAERDRRQMTRESFKTFVEATYTDSGWQKPKNDTMSDADGMKKAKKLAKNAIILTKSADALKKKPVAETKGAPKGYHFTRDGKLKKGDAGADGDGGAKLRSDPLDKQRSKIPPIPEKFANPAQQAAVMAKLKKSGKYDGKEATIPDGQTVMTKKDPVKKNDMDKLAKIRMMLDREKKK